MINEESLEARVGENQGGLNVWDGLKQRQVGDGHYL